PRDGDSNRERGQDPQLAPVSTAVRTDAPVEPRGEPRPATTERSEAAGSEGEKRRSRNRRGRNRGDREERGPNEAKAPEQAKTDTAQSSELKAMHEMQATGTSAPVNRDGREQQERGPRPPR